jgi:hypothetical protein
MQAAQATTALPVRYQGLGLEFAMAFKKLPYQLVSAEERFGSLPHLWLDCT